MERFYQYELVYYDYERYCLETHWVAWFNDDQLLDAIANGWLIYKSWLNTGLVLNKEGKLVLPQE